MKKTCRLLLIGMVFLIALNGCAGYPAPALTSPQPEPAPATVTPSQPTPASLPPAIPPTLEGKTIVVTGAEDSGPGTLRQALLDAQAGDTITFDPAAFPPEQPVTIFLEGEGISLALPEITQGHLTVDASDAGVVLDGSRTGGDWVTCLSIRSNGNTIRGLQIVNFPGSGIGIMDGSQNNIIGGDRNIGLGPLGQGNLSSGNRTGIDLQGRGASNNTIRGNLVGVEVDGKTALGNEGSGVYVANGASHNTIGPGNVIAYNGDGVQIFQENSTGNTITQNSIHDNGPIDISLNGQGNAGIQAPGVIGFDLAAGVVTVMTCPGCKVEIYSDQASAGSVFEIAGTADGMGFLALDKKAPFEKPHLTAIATDADGNSSGFSLPTEGKNLPTPDVAGSTVLQTGNENIKSKIIPKNSAELDDNRMGTFSGSLWHPEREPELYPDGTLSTTNITGIGFKRFRFTINSLDAVTVDWSKTEFSVEPQQDAFITSLADAGVTLTLVLSFWDTDWVMAGNRLDTPRFGNEDAVQRYLDYVRFVVGHFKDRVDYFEIWNEPNLPNPKATAQQIRVNDYIALVKRTAPVIREEDPAAKIVVGGTSSLIDEDSQAYLFAVLNSDIMPLVDVVSWHPMYGSSPAYDRHRQYYYGYPALVRRLKDTACAHGFTGEFVADEIHWPIPSQPEEGWPTYSNLQSVKYVARSEITHLGMDMVVTQLLLLGNPRMIETNACLSTVMAGNRTIDLPVEIESEATPISSYGFSLPNGDHLLALWSDGVAVDYDPGAAATVTIPGYEGWTATAVDILNGFEQELVSEDENGNMVIREFRLKDYPILIRFSQ